MSFGQDLTTGHSFVNGETVTASSLNSIAGNAVINGTFFTAKSLLSSPNASDLVLLYSPSLLGFRTVTVQSLGLTNATLITGQTEDPAPNLGDYILTYSTNGVALRKAQLQNAVFLSLNLISNRTETATPGSNVFYLGWSQANGFQKVQRTNNFWDFWSQAPAPTNMPVLASPTNADVIPIWSSASGTLKQTVLTNLRASIVALSYTNFVSPLITVPAAAAVVTNMPHGLPAAPQQVRWVLVCQTAELGYAVGDEVAVGTLVNGGLPVFQGGANATNVFLIAGTSGPGSLWNKAGNNTQTPITPAKWLARCYATYFYP